MEVDDDWKLLGDVREVDVNVKDIQAYFNHNFDLGLINRELDTAAQLAVMKINQEFDIGVPIPLSRGTKDFITN